MRYLSIVLIFLFTSVAAQSQNKIKWLTWEEALKLNQNERKKLIVDIYTDWCGWCKKMDKTTFQNEHIVSLINEHYYAIKFDAEVKKEIIFNNQVYKYVSSFGKRGFHELAADLLNGKMSYPSLVFIDENLNVIQPIPGYQNPATMEMIATFFAEDHYKTTPWKKFTGNFNSSYFPRKNQSDPSKYQPKVQPVGNR